jgi:hypothetical protein
MSSLASSLVRRAVARGARWFPLPALAALALMGAAPAEAAPSHMCRAGDPPIQASARTSCPFAGNMVNAYANGHAGGRWAGRVKSPVTGRSYRISCRRDDLVVRCSGARGTGIWARFSSLPF